MFFYNILFKDGNSPYMRGGHQMCIDSEVCFNKNINKIKRMNIYIYLLV